MNKNKTVFSNFENERKSYVKRGNKLNGPFMNEFGEDIITEVVQNEIKVKPKNKKIQKNQNNENNSSKN